MAFNPLGKSFILVIQLLRYCLHTLVVRVVLRPFHLTLDRTTYDTCRAVGALRLPPLHVREGAIIDSHRV